MMITNSKARTNYMENQIYSETFSQCTICDKDTGIIFISFENNGRQPPLKITTMEDDSKR